MRLKSLELALSASLLCAAPAESKQERPVVFQPFVSTPDPERTMDKSFAKKLRQVALCIFISRNDRKLQTSVLKKGFSDDGQILTEKTAQFRDKIVLTVTVRHPQEKDPGKDEIIIETMPQNPAQEQQILQDIGLDGNLNTVTKNGGQIELKDMRVYGIEGSRLLGEDQRKELQDRYRALVDRLIKTCQETAKSRRR